MLENAVLLELFKMILTHKMALRCMLAGLVIVITPISVYWYDKSQKVDTDAMLDVSVSIRTISHVRVDAVGDSVWAASGGSGILISKRSCEVLTNHHVVEDAAHIEVFPRQWPDVSGISASIINSNPRTDVAILRMSSCSGLGEALLGDSDQVSSGDEVYAVGNPLGLNPDSISRGIVSHTERFQNGGIPYLQTDANINHGNSGGALFSRNAEVIGMNTGLLATPGGHKFGIGYSLPINLVKKEIEALRAGTPRWGDAGIDDLVGVLTPDEASIFNVPDGHGALVVTEDPDRGPALGKLYEMDVIYKINNLKVKDGDQAKRLISSYDPGDRVSFSLIRRGEPIEVDIMLADGWQSADLPGAEYYDGYLGLSLEMWDDDRHDVRFDSPVITHVKSLGPSHLAHITSSQKTIMGNGSVAIPVQLSVKTITGVVVAGSYYPIKDIVELEQKVHGAYIANKPVLLEIESWGRTKPLNLREPLQRKKTTFHKITPSVADAPPPSPAITGRFDAVALHR